SPHTLPAPTILHAHLLPHLTTQRATLTAALQSTQSANAQLFAEIQSQRAETDALLSAVESALRDVDGANALLADVVEEIAAETRAAEADMRAVSAAAGGGVK
ncbi:hypothetical protein C8A05DRAFT_19893, partial [Staphylotrichum tortipilum]